jgi:putative ABC transport system permease protein
MLTDGMNEVDLISGRMPRRGDECLLDATFYGEEAMGTVLTLSSENAEDTRDTFAFDAYTVVGLANASYYVNFERGNTSLGSGRHAGYVYIPADGFQTDYYTEFSSPGRQGGHILDEYETAISAAERK